MSTVNIFHASDASGQEVTWIPSAGNCGSAVATVDAVYVSPQGPGQANFDDINAPISPKATAYYTANAVLAVPGTTINSITVHVIHEYNGAINSGAGEQFRTGVQWMTHAGNGSINAWDQNPISFYSSLAGNTSYIEYTKTFTTNPVSGVAWTYDDLFTVSGGFFNAFSIYDQAVGVSVANYRLDELFLVVDYTGPMWWELDLPGVTYYEYAVAQPSAYVMPVSVYYNGVNYPAGTSVAWVAGATPTDTGWWLSIDEDFAGNAFVVNLGRPKAPRSYEDIETFATSTAGWLGGSPGPSCVWNNHMVYAEGSYTVGTTAPAIRIFDGTFDREVVQLPNTTAGVVPIGIMSMIAANGTIYLSTLDSGTNSTDWSGRVFSLDIESGQLTPIGTAFPAGHCPYALAWHAGRLWCGTNRQVSTASGKVYYFRPGIDTTWTDDYTLSSSTVAGVSSMLSYKGQLYVGTTNAAAAFAKVLVRSELGVYSTTKTASGGTATANNGILALAEYSGNLYATFWNPDTPAVSLIYKFDNTSWSTAYTGAGTTLVPFVALPVDLSAILAVSGGITYSAVVLSSANGTSWSDKTAFLSQGTPNSTGLNVFGILAL